MTFRCPVRVLQRLPDSHPYLFHLPQAFAGECFCIGRILCWQHSFHAVFVPHIYPLRHFSLQKTTEIFCLDARSEVLDATNRPLDVQNTYLSTLYRLQMGTHLQIATKSMFANEQVSLCLFLSLPLPSEQSRARCTGFVCIRFLCCTLYARGAKYTVPTSPIVSCFIACNSLPLACNIT